MAAATHTTSRGRPRKYSTDAARTQARRVKVRQYVQAHRERRKQEQASLGAYHGPDTDVSHLESPQTSFVTNWRPTNTSATAPNSVKSANDQHRLASKTAILKTSSCCHDNGTTNETLSNRDIHQRRQSDLSGWPGKTGLMKPVTLLSASRFDPFESTCSEFSMQLYDYEVLNHSITHQWPKYSSSPAAAAIAAIKSDITQATWSNRAALYATLFAGSTHLAYRSVRAGLNVEDRAQARRLLYKVKAIEALRGEIVLQQDLHAEGSRLDSIVLCVLILAAHGTGEDIVHQAKQNLTNDDSDPTHPLASAQDVDYYSSMNCELQHWRIIEALVKRRGGLSAIRISGLACAIGLYDVFMARQTLSQPKFPIMLSSEEGVSALARMLPPHATIVAQHSGFSEVLDQKLGGLHAQLLDILHHLRIITAAIDMFDAMLKLQNLLPCDLDKGKQLLWAIMWARHLVQHTLLSLPHKYPECEQDDEHWQREKRLHELGHLAALVYCEMVISPMLGAHEMRFTLCRKLRVQLRWWHERKPAEADMTQHFIGWATLLCIMYCSDHVERSETALLLKRTLYAISEPQHLPTNVTAWPDAKLYLGVEHFLWSTRFMDTKAQRVWNEFMMLNLSV